MQPKLKFFCELNASSLKILFQNEKIIQSLKKIRAGLCLGLRDLSVERAQLVKQLNDANIPVTAWILLPEKSGYWSNLDNAVETTVQYQDFKNWVMENNLTFEAVGLDIEPSITNIKALLERKFRILGSMVLKAIQPGRYSKAISKYNNLVHQIQRDGYVLETYQLPLIVDDRIARSKVLQSLLGIVDLPAEREVLMLYSSFTRPWGPGILWSYGKDAKAIAIGSTGGGLPLPESYMVPLTWDEFELDLRNAWRWSDDLYIFSLEGCIEQDYLERLTAIEWDKPILEPNTITERVEHRRISFQAFLWSLSRFPLFVVLCLTVILLVRMHRNWRYPTKN
jgi:hypothetical protein